MINKILFKKKIEHIEWRSFFKYRRFYPILFFIFQIDFAHSLRVRQLKIITIYSNTLWLIPRMRRSLFKMLRKCNWHILLKHLLIGLFFVCFIITTIFFLQYTGDEFDILIDWCRV